MGKKISPEESQRKHDKHMQTLKHLNNLRPEIINRIDGDGYITFKKMDQNPKSMLGDYFKSHTYIFDQNTTVSDIIRHFKKNIPNIDFLTKPI